MLCIGPLYQVMVYTSYDFALLNNSKDCFRNFPISVRAAVSFNCSNYLFFDHCLSYSLMRAEISRM